MNIINQEDSTNKEIESQSSSKFEKELEKSTSKISKKDSRGKRKVKYLNPLEEDP